MAKAAAAEDRAPPMRDALELPLPPVIARHRPILVSTNPSLNVCKQASGHIKKY